MMGRFVIHVILLLSAFRGLAQKDSVRLYLDANLQFTSKKDFAFAAMAVKEKNHWRLYAVYPDTTPVLNIYFADADLTIMDGSYVLYYPKRVMAQQGNFKNNIPNGMWQSWYTNGQLKSEGDIVDNNLSGVWRVWYTNGQLKSEQTYLYKTHPAPASSFHENSPAKKIQKLVIGVEASGLLEGASATWYENGNKESAVNYNNDSLAGVCWWYRENGKPSSKETYEHGKVTALECFDEEGKLTGSSCSILKPPVLIHPMFSALDYIEYELHKEKLRDIKEEGEAEISFNVTKKGTVENLVFLSSPDADLTKHITKIVSTMPPWSPAVVHNRAVDYPFKIVIPYYRN